MVAKGIQWLLDNGSNNEGWLSRKGKVFGPVRGHAIALSALAEYYALTKDERLTPLLKDAMEIIVQGQAADGGWAADYQPKAGNMEESIWQIQALKSFYLTGLYLPEVNATLNRAMKFIDSKRAKDGSYAQSVGATPRQRDRQTAMAVLAQLTWRQNRKDLRDSMSYLLENHGGEEQLDYRGKDTDLAGVHLRMNAFLYYGGSAWLTWARTFQEPIANAQSEDGSWPSMAAPGYRKLQSSDDLSGAVYRTAMMALAIPSFRIRYFPPSEDR
jgi:hypothetical protein